MFEAEISNPNKYDKDGKSEHLNDLTKRAFEIAARQRGWQVVGDTDLPLPEGWNRQHTPVIIVIGTSQVTTPEAMA